jgi:ribosomal protein RSM22 (predicted rRNA methylase)
MSDNYRTARPSRTQVDTEADVLAYLAVRAPATYAAVRRVIEELATRLPDACPATMLDVGCGPGTALWAVLARWPNLRQATMIDANINLLGAGRHLAGDAPIIGPRLRWQYAELPAFADAGSADLVVASYTLGELPPAELTRLVHRLWQRATQAIVVVEPGTPRGFHTVSTVRAALIEAGAHLIAPCPSNATCPKIEGPSWCHFPARLPRTKQHRQIKQASLGHEDEKYAYVAVARTPGRPVEARVVAAPQHARGRTTLQLCQAPDLLQQTLSRRDGSAYRTARQLVWGSALPKA